MIGILHKPKCMTQPSPPVVPPVSPPAPPAPPAEKKPFVLRTDIVPLISVDPPSPLYAGLGKIQEVFISLDGQQNEIEIQLPNTGGIRGNFKNLSVYPSAENVTLTANHSGQIFHLKGTRPDLYNLSAQEVFDLLNSDDSNRIRLEYESDSSSPFFIKSEGLWLIDATKVSVPGIEDLINLPTYVKFRFTGDLDSIRKPNKKN